MLNIYFLLGYVFFNEIRYIFLNIGYICNKKIIENYLWFIYCVLSLIY